MKNIKVDIVNRLKAAGEGE